MTGDLRGHATSADDRPWRGRFAIADHDGKCQVCETAIRAGQFVVISDTLHRASHHGCGQTVARRDPK
jgi:hypothetical protein